MGNARSFETSFVDTGEVIANLNLLLERVESGEEIVITSHGLPIAKLVRTVAEPSVAEKIEAIRSIREVASRNRLLGLSVKEMIETGRK